MSLSLSLLINIQTILFGYRLAFKLDDIFKYFETLQDIPLIEDLEKMAKTLYRTYSTTRGLHHALNDADLPHENSNWTRNVPVGTPWTGPTDDLDIGLSFSKTILRSVARKQREPRKKKKQTKVEREAERERDAMRKHGDHVLSNSIAFMCDTLLSRECAAAVTSGDVGRVWEVLKVRISQIIVQSLTLHFSR